MPITREPTTEMLFPIQDGTEGDYLRNTKGEISILNAGRESNAASIPRRYWDKKMILILKSAAYHHGMASAWDKRGATPCSSTTPSGVPTEL